jgi:hypothetical protein
MTHDDLMDKIDTFDCAGMIKEQAATALRSLVEAHKPDDKGQCKRCREMLVTMAGYSQYGPSWPCIAVGPIIRSFEILGE